MLRDMHSNSQKSLREAAATRKSMHDIQHSLREQKAGYTEKLDRVESVQTKNVFYILCLDGVRSAEIRGESQFGLTLTNPLANRKQKPQIRP